MKNFFFILFASAILTSCNDMGSCDRFNIDSYELITGLDVPKVTHVNCFEDGKYRTTVFSLDPAGLASASYGDIEGYTDRFNFDRNRQPVIMQDISVGRDMATIANQGAVYFKEGESKNHLWRAAIIPAATELILEIERK